MSDRRTLPHRVERSATAEHVTTGRAPGFPRLSTPHFVGAVLMFATLLWGTLARGAFLRVDLTVFVVLAVLTAALAVAGRRVRPATVGWWLAAAVPVAVAVVLSARAAHDLADAGYAIAPVVAAAAIGLAGSTLNRLAVQRVVADVAALAAVLGWVGVAGHVPPLAVFAGGTWRAAGPIGYPSATALLLLIGLLCAAGVAAGANRTGDYVRCAVIAVGLFATEFRGAVALLVLCVIVLCFACRRMARILVLCAGCAVVAFAGLIPAMRGMPLPADIAAAVAGAGASGWVLFGIRRTAPKPFTRPLVIILLSSSIVAIGVLFGGRLLDLGSYHARLRIWRHAVGGLRDSGYDGTGPRPLADAGRGVVGPLFLHNDAVQFVGFYGVLGAGALLVLGGWALVLLVRARDRVQPVPWATGLCVVLATAGTALMDFPLQIPLLPAVACAALGATLRPGQNSRNSVESVPRSAS